MQPERELLRKWGSRNVYGRFHLRLEIGAEGLILGAGTVLAKTATDSRGRPHLPVDKPRVMALLATAYGKPVAPDVLARLRRAAELWNEGEKALAHIHLAHANLPPCGEDETLRLFLADECFSEGITPAELMKAQGYVSALLALLKYNPDQPRVPAGSGRESGEWTDGEAIFTPVAYRGGRRERRHGGGGRRFDAIRSFLEYLRELLKPKEGEPVPEAKPPHEEEPESTPPKVSPPELEISPPKPSDFVGEDYGKLGIGIEKPDLEIRELDPHAIEMMAERGVSLKDLQDTVDHPLIVLQQSRGRVFYLSDDAAVVLNPRGRVITTYSAADFDAKIKALLDHVHK